MAYSNDKDYNIKTGQKAIFDFSIGADPEFVMVDNKSLMDKNILRDGDIFGIDGNGVSFEVRPDPSLSPLEVTHNIRSIFVRQCLKNPKFMEYDWFAGSFQREYPLGGHIHFGIKENVINPKKAANILSQYVGAITVLIEEYDQGCRRRQDHHGYGQIEDTRPKSYGFEYRTPASWITSPIVASAILCLAKVVMFEALNNDK